MDANNALVRFLVREELLKECPQGELEGAHAEGVLLRLARKGLLDEAEALARLSSYFKIEILNLSDPLISDKINKNDVNNRVSGDICWRNKLVPLWENNKQVVVAIANPFNFEAIQQIKFCLDREISPVLAPEQQIIKILNLQFPHNELAELAGNQNELQILPASTPTNEEELDSNDPNTPAVIKLTNRILLDAVAHGASDVHLEPSSTNMSVRFRIDGILQDIINIPQKIQGNIVTRLKVLSSLNVAERRRPQDGRIRVQYDGKGIDLRMSTVPTSYGEKVVLRVLQTDYSSVTFSSLGMTTDLISRLDSALHKEGKLFLVTGPTGAGKTTTLYVALNSLQDGKVNITTIEDPIEYRFPKINQIQINNQANITFASVLRSVFRQDPDIIMLGEIRDAETLSVTLQAAQTGHLVFSTLHTNDAPSAISRLTNLGGDPSIIASSLIGVLAQRLVRKVCSSCAMPLSLASQKKYKRYIDKYKLNPAQLREGKGCDRCLTSGYKGRVGLYSYLEITDRVAEVIHRSGSLDEVVQVARSQGYIDLEECAIQEVRKGNTTIDEIIGYLSDVSTPTVAHGMKLEEGAPHRSPPVDSPQRSGKKKVLIVDDNTNVRKMVATLLNKELVAIREAINGLDALSQLQEETPDLIICDISMPEMTGIDFLKRVKRNVHLRDVPVVMLTADDTPDKELELRDLGAVEFISKRTLPPLLIARIRTVLQGIK